MVVALIGTLVATAPTQIGASQGYECDGQPATIVVEEEGVLTVGTDGDDVIVGTFGDDQIDGGLGNDTICGHAGDDVLTGGPGNDHIQGGNGTDQVLGGDGDDVLFGGNGDDEVNGEAGTDIVLGEGGDDTLIGDPTTDTLWPGLGVNEIIEVDESAVVEDPAPEAPADDAPSDEAPADDAPSDEVPADDASSDEVPADDPPSEDALSDEAPAFDADAPLFTDMSGLLEPGTTQFTAGGTPFTADFPESWQVLFSISEFIAFGNDEFRFDATPVNELALLRANVLSNPEEAGTPIESQVAPLDVDDLDNWLAAIPAEIFSSAPVDTTFGGRDAVLLEVFFTDTSLCQEGVLCLSLGGNATVGFTLAYEPDVRYTTWIVDMGEFDPIFVTISDNGETERFVEEANEVASSFAFGEPGPNPSPRAEAPWEIGGFGEVPAGPVEFPVAGGVAVDIPLESVAGQIQPGLHFLSMGLQPFPGELEIFTPVADPLGNPVTTVGEFIAAGDVVGFSAVELGAVETRLGAGIIVDITGPEVPTFALPDEEPTPEEIGILTDDESQFGWMAPRFARAVLIESDRGLLVVTAELFQGERADLDPLIAYAEEILPSLRFVDTPDGAPPLIGSEVAGGVVAPGEYILDFASGERVLVQTTQDVVLPFLGPDLIPVVPLGLEDPGGLPVGPALLDVDEVIINNDGDTAPTPDDLGAFFAADERLVIEDQGTLPASGVEAQWWELTVAPGQGLTEGCPFGECAPIFVNTVAEGGVNIGTSFDFRVYEIPDPDGTLYVISQGPAEIAAEAFAFTDSVLTGVEVLPAAEVIEFEEGDILGIEPGSTFAPGTYFSSGSFSVPFELVTDQDWRLGFAADTLVGIESPDFSVQDGFQAAVIIEPTSGFADPATIGGPEAPVESTIGIPTDLVAWADEIPQLEVLNSGTRTISGIEALFVDLNVTGPADRNGDCGGANCLRLFEWAFDGWNIVEGSPMRIYVVELADTTMVITVEGPTDTFDDFVAETLPLLDGITFG